MRSSPWSAAAASVRSWSAEMKPSRYAAVSGAPMSRPLRCCWPPTHVCASSSASNVPTSNHSVENGRLADLEPAVGQVAAVDLADLELAPGARADRPRDLDDAVVVEVQARDHEVRRGDERLLVDGDHVALGVELEHAVALRVGHPEAEHDGTVRRRCGPAAARRGATRRRCCRRGSRATSSSPMNVLADQERRRDPVGLGLHGVLEPAAPLRPVTEQRLEQRAAARGWR